MVEPETEIESGALAVPHVAEASEPPGTELAGSTPTQIAAPDLESSPPIFEPRFHLPASLRGFPLLRLEFAARVAQHDNNGLRVGPSGSEAMRIELDLSAAEISALARLGNEVGANTPDAAKTALRDWLIAHGYLDGGTQARSEERMA